VRSVGCLLPEHPGLSSGGLFRPEELNRAVGIWVSASATATAPDRSSEDCSSNTSHGRASFLINLPIGAIALVVGALV